MSAPQKIQSKATPAHRVLALNAVERPPYVIPHVSPCTPAYNSAHGTEAGIAPFTA